MLVMSSETRNTSCKIPGWMKHKLESRLLGEIPITSDMQMTPPLGQKVKKKKGFPGGSEVKASACNVGDLGSIPGLGRSDRKSVV